MSKRTTAQLDEIVCEVLPDGRHAWNVKGAPLDAMLFWPVGVESVIVQPERDEDALWELRTLDGSFYYRDEDEAFEQLVAKSYGELVVRHGRILSTQPDAEGEGIFGDDP